MLRVQSHLEKVREAAAVVVGASGAAGANRSGMNDVVAGRMLRESRDSSVAIDSFGSIHVPLGPAIGRAVRATRLHGGNVVGVASHVCSEPSHYDVPIGIRRDPRKHIGFAHGWAAIHAHGSGPRVP